MRVTVLSPERSLYDGDAEAIVAPAYDGQIGILPRHAPLTVLLGEGELAVTHGAGVSRFTLAGGFLQVVDDVVRVVAERAEARPATA
jgi:F-type H+-transporting ATPase subunit epsilon